MLELKNISKTFNKGTVNEKTVFSNLSLTVNDGDFITIIGSNGAGKSTLFNLIGGSILADEGKIVLDGKDITLKKSYKRAKDIGRLFQEPKLGTAGSMTIEENLALCSKSGSWLSFVSKKEKEAFKERLRYLDMGLEERMKQPVGLLSGGQRQALSLLMATYNTPKLLLLDEHTAALDPKAQEQVLKITREVVEENNLTCLMITHDMKMALEMGNRTIMMQNGQIVVDISGKERANMTVEGLLALFKEKAGEALLNDRMLLGN
ncbi:MAG: ATP-binding cassette domain-containing protein [Bacilli bacterium]|nr:ATP-binding cassette domain-containing protein [Bacilli bacterium]